MKYTPFFVFSTLLLLLAPVFADQTSQKGIKLDGHTGYVLKDVKIPPQAFSVGVRVRLTDDKDSQILASLGGPGEDFSLYLYNGQVRMLVENRPGAAAGPGGAYDYAAAPLPEPGEWTHYLGVYDGNTITIYRNGKKAGEKKTPLHREAFSRPLHIGAGPVQGRQLRGEIDHLCIWNRVLSPVEASDIFQGRTPENGLLAQWTVAGLTDAGLAEQAGRTGKAVPFKPAVATSPTARTQSVELLNRKDDGYRGVWYHNQRSQDEYVFKYSGGLGTYPANHYPFAVYAPEVKKTFFCYGGTDKESEKTLLHEVSYFDHQTKTVARPTILLDKKTNDAHDNPVMNMDDRGYIWIFSTSHGTGRPSFIHRSKKPYDIEEFVRIEATKLRDEEEVSLDNFSYMQIYHLRNKGFAALFTTYDRKVLADPNTIAARILCSMSSTDGVRWSSWRPYAGILIGHYQSSGTFRNEKIGTAFNQHPNDKESGRVGLNWRTNLYYMETSDLGETWKNVRGESIETPLKTVENPALVHDYFAEKLNVYIMDVNFDARGNPIILYLTSKGYESGPKNDPRRWYTAAWTGERWKIDPVTDSDNNYDFGSLYIEGNGLWRIIGTTETGPQPYNTGGEVAMWTSRDRGTTWKKVRQMTSGSRYNHCYPRRPVNAHPDFYALWASGHGREKSESTLYFCNKDGDVFELPRQMTGALAQPVKVDVEMNQDHAEGETMLSDTATVDPQKDPGFEPRPRSVKRGFKKPRFPRR